MSKRPRKRKRRFNLAALVARKIEEHAKLSKDAMKIAIALALAFIVLMFANAFHETWKDMQRTPAPTAKAQQR